MLGFGFGMFVPGNAHRAHARAKRKRRWQQEQRLQDKRTSRIVKALQESPAPTPAPTPSPSPSPLPQCEVALPTDWETAMRLANDRVTAALRSAQQSNMRVANLSRKVDELTREVNEVQEKRVDREQVNGLVTDAIISVLSDKTLMGKIGTYAGTVPLSEEREDGRVMLETRGQHYTSMSDMRRLMDEEMNKGKGR